MISSMEEKISNAVYKCWSTVYSDEWIGVDWDGKGQGFSVHSLSNGEFEIDFHVRKEWWLPGERVVDVKSRITRKLKEAGLDITKLRIYGAVFTISWMDNRKFVKIHRINFVEKS